MKPSLRRGRTPAAQQPPQQQSSTAATADRDDQPRARPPLHRRVIAPSRGWRGPAGGRAAHIEAGAVYLGTTTEVAGLFPFLQASGLPSEGVPIGPDLFSGEMVCLDPAGWVGTYTSNPGMFILGQPGVGKALDADTAIPTPDGWTSMAQLRPGDYVFDEHGHPTPIVATSPIWTGRDCYRVLFSDGASLIADAEHLWQTHVLPFGLHPGLGRQESYGPRERTVRDGWDALPSSSPPPYPPPQAVPEVRWPILANTVQLAAALADPSGRPRHAIPICPPPSPGRASLLPGGYDRARPAYRYVVAVERVPTRPVRCIQVAADSGLFLAGRACITTHNSAITKRMCLCLAGYGYTVLVPGDVKGEYRDLVTALGGQVVRIGRGLDRINPLDAGPLGRKLPTLPIGEQNRLLAEINGRRSELVHALLATAHGLSRRPTATESTALNTAIRLAVLAAPGIDPTIPDVVNVLRTAPAELMSKLMATSSTEYLALTRELVAALENLCDGPLQGLFDARTTTQLDLDASAVSVDLSALLTAGDTVVAAGLLATWAYSYSAVDTARALGFATRPVVLALDELWRALRAGPGMVTSMDAITRLNRAKGEVSLMVTHSLGDLQALPTQEDRAKALGLLERCDTTILAAMPASELLRFSEQKPLTDRERMLVASWAAPAATGVDGTAQVHPARGKLLVKIGHRIGVPARLQLTAAERRMYDTDGAIHRQRPDQPTGGT